MDSLFEAFAHELRRQIVLALWREPGLKHGELLTVLGLPETKKGTLTKHLHQLESAGILARTGGQIELTDPHASGGLLVSAGTLNVSAKRQLAERAQQDIGDAEQVAAELRRQILEA